MVGAFEDLVAGLDAGEADRVLRALGDDTVLHVAVHAEPFTGRDAMGFIFEHLFSGIFSNVGVRKMLADGDERVAVFDVDVAGYDRSAEGLIVCIVSRSSGIGASGATRRAKGLKVSACVASCVA